MKDHHRITCATAPKRNSLHWVQGEVTWADLRDWVREPGDTKEAGNYVLGTLRPTTKVHPAKPGKPCTGMHRDKTGVVSRDALTLDVDRPSPGFLEKVELTWPWAALVHTTYSSAPDAPRYRLILPLDRTVAPDEYHALANVVMDRLGRDSFDPSSVEPHRYMFKPASSQPDWYVWTEVDGDLLPSDELLEAFDPDALATLPAPAPNRTKRDPYSIDGPVGAFNRAYDDLGLLIETFDLPYEDSGSERWHLVGARSVAGMGPIQGAPGLYFSHHSNDPAGGVTCSAFDLVRLHRFSELDEGVKPGTPVNKLPSHVAMLDLAAGDRRVVADLVGEDFTAELEDIADGVDAEGWRQCLHLTRQGKFADVIENWDLVRKHDPVFSRLRYNELALAVETDGDLPWRTLARSGPIFNATDRADLAHYLERAYGVRLSRAFLDELVNTTAHNVTVNPIRDYLQTLVWDGIPRVETCLPGVRTTDFTRVVARKSLVAAVARMLDPGVKWDHTLVLYGSEGLGKSWWIDKLAKGWSAGLGRIGDKDTLLTMQRSWIMVSDEGHSLRKADADAQKEFLTRTVDVYRAPYEREAVPHPRHCVIWGTTNDEVFLRRQEGNRRFLIVRCEDKVDFDLITEDYVDQLWAEAVHLYRAGERLFLADDESTMAAVEREFFTEEDALAGVLQEYLDTLVPDGWEEMSPESRSLWYQSHLDGQAHPPGRRKMTQTCTVQLWVEALGNQRGAHRRTDLLDINTALKNLPNWVATHGRRRMPGYGPQQVFERISSEDLL